LQLMAEDSALDQVLTALMKTVEASSANTLFASIMIADGEGQRLRYASAPSLPPAFTAALDGLPVKPGAASCGTAVALKRPIYVANVGDDVLWVDYRETALAHGLGACWSTPIFSKEGGVLGSFAMYFPQTHEVNDQDIRMVEMATRTAAIAIERERQHRALRESEARYRALMEQASEGIFVSEPDGRHTMVNAAGQRMLGYTSEELLKLRIQDHYLLGEYAADESALRNLEPGKSLRIERKMRRKDGSTFDVEASVSVLPSGLIHRSLRDVTERKNAEAALLDAKESAEAASRSKDRFLAVLSHELRTPLTPVLMAVTALDSDPDLSHDLKQDIQMIRRNVELETKLIDDLLDLSRITSGKLRLRPEAVKLNDVIRQVCGICRSQILEKGIRLHCDLGSEEDRVMADPARFQQVLWNVLKNAAKFTPESGSIFVTTARVAGNRWRIQVRDTGLGIAAEILPRGFDAFEQGDPKITRQFGGLGLGLAISKAIVDLHQGSISVSSDGVGRGSVFSIEMPCAMKQESARGPEAPLDGEAAPEQMRLLVVEDHVDTARTLGRMLSRRGYVVKTAGDVASALKLASSESFDLIISDLGLPDATGYELMKTVRSFSSVKGIAMSGFGMDEDIRKSREAGFEEHLVKPVDIPRLQQAIRRLLETR